MKNGEHKEQATFFAWVRLNMEHAPNPHVKEIMEIAYGIPNGANLSKKSYQNKKGEWKTWSPEAKWLKEEGSLNAGIPDINFPVPVFKKAESNPVYASVMKYAGLYIEMKIDKKKPSKEQKRKKYLLEKVGYQKVEVCYSAVEAIRTVYDYLPFKKCDYQGISEYLPYPQRY